MLKINKGMSIILASMIAGSMLVGCSKEEATEQQDNTVTTKQEQQAESEFKQFNLIDNEYCTIDVVGESRDSIFGYGYNILITNKSDRSLLIGADDVSIDGMMDDPMWATEVAPGKKAKSSINWADITNMEDLKNIEITFRITDNDSWNTLAEETIVINNNQVKK